MVSHQRLPRSLISPAGVFPRRPASASFGLREARAALTRTAIAKGDRLRPDPREGRKLGDRPVCLRGFLRRPRLGGGEPAPQDFVLGLQGLDVGFEDSHKRIVFAAGYGAGRSHSASAYPAPCAASSRLSAASACPRASPPSGLAKTMVSMVNRTANKQ